MSRYQGRKISKSVLEKRRPRHGLARATGLLPSPDGIAAFHVDKAC
jgi:hypothetical protein